MDTITQQNNTQPQVAPVTPSQTAVPVAPMTTKDNAEANHAPRHGRSRSGGASGHGPRGGKRSARPEKVKSEFDQRILNIRRVTRVVTGGRRFAFSVAIVIGNKKGSIGVGTGKAGDTSLAIDKALRNAKKNLLKVKTTKSMSIPHEVSAKYSSGSVIIRPAKGRGLIAGSATRDLLELAGISDVSAKIISPSKNKLNIAQATIKALAQLKSPKVKAVATDSMVK